MTDTYQPIYDAVRSRIGSCDIDGAVRSAIMDQSIGHHIYNALQEIVAEYNRPFVLYRPRLAPDGNAWIACLGDNLQEGVVGVGATPDEASRNFDQAWYAHLKPYPPMVVSK